MRKSFIITRYVITLYLLGHTKVLRLLLAEVKAKVQSTDVLNDFLEQRPDIHPLNLAAREGHVKVIQILAEAKVHYHLNDCIRQISQSQTISCISLFVIHIHFGIIYLLGTN